MNYIASLPRLLVIEDNSEIRQLLVSFFENRFEVNGFARGDEGLKSFLEQTPKAVILDLELEGSLQGQHLLPLMKAYSPETLIVVVTGSSHLKRGVLELKPDIFIEKPFNIQQIAAFFQMRKILPS